jgi:hypothetical protein
MLQIEKYSLGIGDRFGKQGLAQLRAVQQAERAGAVVVPVWNKSFREHSLIGTKPDDVRRGRRRRKRGGWKPLIRRRRPHRRQERRRSSPRATSPSTSPTTSARRPGGALARSCATWCPPRPAASRGSTARSRSPTPCWRTSGKTYLYAVHGSRKDLLARRAAKGERNFIAEVSTDEATEPQPGELFFIRVSAREDPGQTIAPVLGQVPKGIDRRRRAVFAREFGRTSRSSSTRSASLACRPRSSSASAPGR